MGNQKLSVKLQNKLFMTVLLVCLRSVGRLRLEDKEGVMNVRTNTPSCLKVDITASEEEEEGMRDDYTDM